MQVAAEIYFDLKAHKQLQHFWLQKQSTQTS